MFCNIYSNNILEYLDAETNTYFDGTFKKCPKQFLQLWTIFIEFGRYVLPAIHCLLTSKSEQIYIATLLKIKELLPQLSPSSAMSDWEGGARNAIKIVYHNQAVWERFLS